MAEEYNKKSDEHEYERKTGDYEEGSGAGETKDRGLFDFLGKKEEEKPTPYQQGDQVNVAEFDEKVKISDHHDQHASSYNKVEEKEDKEKKHETLLQKLHRSESSSSSSSDEEEDEEKKKKRKEKKGLTDKIKEKISGDEHKEEGYHKEEDTAVPVEKVYEEEHHHPAPAPAPVVHYHEEPTDSPTEEKKGFLEKIKEKLPGHKKTEEVPVGAASHEQHSDDKHAAEPPVAASYEAGEEPKEKKGILEKIKEKLPGYHSKTEEDHKDINEKEKDTPSY